MKRSLFVVVALAHVLAFAGTAAAQPRAGGYKPAATDDAEVVAAAHFAVTRHAAGLKLVAIEHAASQVVAGINYQLCLKVEGDDGKELEAKAVVYKNLQQEYDLTSWDDGSCE